VNTTVTNFNLSYIGIGDESASVLANALKMNTSLNYIDLCSNAIGDEGAVALVDALKVNTSVISIDLSDNAINESKFAIVKDLLARNERLRCVFLFDARHMLLSLMCVDECSVVRPYLLESDDTDGIDAPGNIETLRVEFADVLKERRRCR
jgi:hypothetical protein